MYAFFSAMHHRIRHLGKSRENKVRRDHPTSSNDIMKDCQMPVVPPLSKDKQVTFSAKHSCTPGLFEVSFSFASELKKSVARRLCLLVTLTAKPPHIHSYLFVGDLLSYSVIRRGHDDTILPCHNLAHFTPKKPPFSQRKSLNTNHLN